MADFIRLLSSLREQMNAELTRSDVMRPLIWPTSGLLVLLAILVQADAPDWILMFAVIALAVFLALHALAFGFFAITDSDALRSEKYKLHKMAIEQGLYGDSSTGLQKIEDMPEGAKLIEAAPTEGIAHD